MTRAAAGSAWTLRDAPAGLSAKRLVVLEYDVPDREVNVLTEATLLELSARLDEVAAMSVDGLIVVSGKTRGFIAGADVQAI